MAKENKLTIDERRELEHRRLVADLESKLAAAPRHVGMLTTLMHLYHELGMEKKRIEVMYRLREIPNEAELRAEARAFINAVSVLDKDDDPGGVEKLRAAYADLFDLLEGRTEVRPAVVMEAMACTSTFAVELLRSMHRIGVVTADEGLGLRRVIWQALSDGGKRLKEADAQDCSWRERDVNRLLAWLCQGGCQTVQLCVGDLMRQLGWGYNHAALIGDMAAERGILLRGKDPDARWTADRKAVKALAKKGGLV